MHCTEATCARARACGLQAAHGCSPQNSQNSARGASWTACRVFNILGGSPAVWGDGVDEKWVKVRLKLINTAVHHWDLRCASDL